MKNLIIDSIDSWNIKKQEKLIIAGPCSAESYEQVMETAEELSKFNVNILRAGIWKPRTRPNSFEGVGKPGLKWLKEAGEKFNMPVTVEVANSGHIKEALDSKIDILWIGARTTVNPFTVQEIADSLKGVDIPVMIKNPVNPDIDLWIGAIERLNQAGIKKIAVIHRGFSSFKQCEYRNIPEWELIVELRRRIPELPIICDPSHICGNRELLLSVSQIAMDLLYDGLMIESHINPDTALSDASQQLTPKNLKKLLDNLQLKREYIKDKDFHIEIEKIREQIDAIDYKIIGLLAERKKLSENIGKKKKLKKVSIFQPERWNAIAESRISTGKKYNLSEEFILKLFSKIHQESIGIQRKK
ncbi:MAG: bifunctional 3-deoxy-7-phosphoheptulonate synthase/chorismate mutase type II [Deltaproteobacteria bacterium]|nr:bifunctional 3-deoxy-7-phosphoheptulonate synthase/chorismate mutase type II [Deltaproteobacteria bacterium]